MLTSFQPLLQEHQPKPHFHSVAQLHFTELKYPAQQKCGRINIMQREPREKKCLSIMPRRLLGKQLVQLLKIAKTHPPSTRKKIAVEVYSVGSSHLCTLF